MGNLTRLLDAESEVLSLNEIKAQIRVTTTADDDSFRQFLAAIRRQMEHYLGQTLITSTWEYKLDAFSDEICLPMSPIQSITTVAYVDTDEAPQTFTDFEFDKSGRLRPKSGFVWPSTYDQYDAITITYIAGQLNAGEVAEDIKQAMLLYIGALDIGREDAVIGAGIVVSNIPNDAARFLAAHRKWAV